MAEPFPVVGLIGNRWRELGGADGPFGNPLGPEQDVPGHRGRRQSFVGGEIAWSPDSDMVTSVYRMRNQAAFMWSIPNIAHDSFRYEISYDGAGLGHSNVQLRAPDPRIDVKLQGFGEFAFIARSCDGDDMDDCSAWSIPVRVSMARATETPPPPDMFPVLSPLEERWHELGAWSGYLGKPTAAENVSSDGTRSQPFEHGMISTAPAFPGMVIAVYQRGRRLEITWGGGDRPFNAFQVDVFHSGAKFLEALVQPPLVPAAWARAAIAPGHYSFVPQKGDGDYTFVIFPTLAPFFGQAWLPPNLDPNVIQDPPTPSGTVSFLSFPFGRTNMVSARFVRGVADAEMKYPEIGATPAAAFANQVLRAQDIAKHHIHKERIFHWPARPANEDNTLLLVAHLEACEDDPEYRTPGELPALMTAHALLRSMDRGHGQVGTEFDEGLLGSKLGDYDMAIKGLMVVAHRYRHRLTIEQIDFMLRFLMPVNISGRPDPNDHAYPFLTEILPETENHLLMINSTKYLVNQHMFERTGDPFFDNRSNGTFGWLLNFLHTISKHDFLEFNSRPYNRLALHPVLNLHEFAKDREIVTAAHIVLDYAFMKFAVSSCRLRRLGPFRRLHQNMNRTCNGLNILMHDGGNDPLIGFFLSYAGNSDRDGRPIKWYPDQWTLVSLITASAAYRPPPEAYQVALEPTEVVQHSFFHGQRPRLVEADEDADGGVEIYHKTPSFILSAGGLFLNSGYGGDQFTKMKQVAYPQATTLLFTRAQDVPEQIKLNVNYEDLIRFEPFPSVKEGDSCTFEGERFAVNTGVHKGFACGANLIIPTKWLDLTGTPITGTPGRPGWYLLDLNQNLRDYGSLGVYVAAYRTPVRDADLLEELMHVNFDFGAAPANLGLLYVVDAVASRLSFDDFAQQVIDRNTALPVMLGWDAPHTFFSPGPVARKFEFWAIRPFFNKYSPRIFRVDDVPIPPEGSVQQLAKGPYIDTPGGHNGRTEIRAPRQPDEADVALILDFSNRENPVRLDNRESLPRPWIERARAIRDLAGRLLVRSSEQSVDTKFSEAIASVRNALRVLRQLEPPIPEQAPHLAMVGKALHALVQRFIEAGRPAEAATPATEAIAALRLAAAAPGADITAIARELIELAGHTHPPQLQVQTAAAAQAAADLLRPLNPPANHQAAHLLMFGMALQMFVLRLFVLGQIAQAVGPADETIAVLRRAGAAPGADVTTVAGRLIDFAGQTHQPELREQTAAAAGAAADLLRPLNPPAAEQVAHLVMLGTALRMYVLRLGALGHTAQAAVAADEAIAVLRRAGGASGANISTIVSDLLIFAGQLASLGLDAQSQAAMQAAQELKN